MKVTTWILTAAITAFFLGCSKKDQPTAEEKEAIVALEAYGAKFEYNPTGHVHRVVLEGRRVDDLALDQLVHLPELHEISLYGSSVTDSGLAKLRESPRLNSIGLGNTNISRRGLANIETMPSLEWVWLTDTPKLTAKDIEDFKKKAVPTLTVYTE